MKRPYQQVSTLALLIVVAGFVLLGAPMHSVQPGRAAGGEAAVVNLIRYTVRRGDTLYSIAQQHNTTTLSSSSQPQIMGSSTSGLSQ
jgi:hypothetical protein